MTHQKFMNLAFVVAFVAFVQAQQQPQPPQQQQQSKLLVGLGLNSDGILDDVEVVDLVDDKKCSVPDFPYRVYGVIGTIGLDGNPFICGGAGDGPSEYHDQCQSLESTRGQWVNTFNMTEKRAYASMVNVGKEMIVTGGGNAGVGLEGISNTAESLTSDGFKSNENEIPSRIYFHCSVALNETALILIGGATGNVDTSLTYAYDVENDAWASGPSLKYGRHHHACAMVEVDGKYRIVVVGGVNGTAMTSVEILDEGSDHWTAGPELPFGIYRSVLVPDGKGGVILVGGQTQDTRFLDTLYHLSVVNSDSKAAAAAEWKLMPQKLKTKRSFHTAFLVDDCDVEKEDLELETESPGSGSEEEEDDTTVAAGSVSAEFS